MVPGKVANLPGTYKHDSWQDLDEMLQSYIRLGRRAAQFDTKQSKPYMILFNPLLTFIKQYIFKQGFRDGRRGFIASAAAATTGAR